MYNTDSVRPDAEPTAVGGGNSLSDLATYATTRTPPVLPQQQRGAGGCSITISSSSNKYRRCSIASGGPLSGLVAVARGVPHVAHRVAAEQDGVRLERDLSSQLHNSSAAGSVHAGA